MANYKLLGTETHMDFNTIEEINEVIMNYRKQFRAGDIRVIDMIDDIEMEIHYEDDGKGNIVYMEVVE